MEFARITIYLLLLTGVLMTPAWAQEVPDLGASSASGPVKLVIYERIYLIRNERNLPPSTRKIAAYLYDRNGEMSRASEFGNGEKRTVYDRSVRPSRISVFYFDESGTPTTRPFVPNSDLVDEAGLCSVYSVKGEEDKRARINREIEICADGTRRAQITYEFDGKDRLFREFRQDTKGRSWESKFRYANDDDEFPEFIFTVNDLSKPQYTWVVTYADAKLDFQKNWTHVVGSSFHSARPGRLINQFIEKRTIEYYPD